MKDANPLFLLEVVFLTYQLMQKKKWFVWRQNPVTLLDWVELGPNMTLRVSIKRGKITLDFQLLTSSPVASDQVIASLHWKHLFMKLLLYSQTPIRLYGISAQH